MRSRIFYRAQSQVDYELEVEHEPDQYVPKFLSEDITGEIQDLSTDRNWPTLIQMTNDLKIEIISWGSEIGD